MPDMPDMHDLSQQPDPDTVADQLHAELTMRAGSLGVLLGRQWAPVATDVARRITDDVDLADTAMRAMWPVSDPPDPWWVTPLGRTMAARSQRGQAAGISWRTAAEWLDVKPGTVSQLVKRGTIARAKSGGLLVASVLDYALQRRRRPHEPMS